MGRASRGPPCALRLRPASRAPRMPITKHPTTTAALFSNGLRRPMADTTHRLSVQRYSCRQGQALRVATRALTAAQPPPLRYRSATLLTCNTSNTSVRPFEPDLPSRKLGNQPTELRENVS